MPTPREELAKKLREVRIAAGFSSHAALAKVLHVSRSLIAKAESAAQPLPTESTLAAWAKATGVPLDELNEVVERARSGAPEWFMPYETEEAKASVIRCWSPFVVPGLGQTRAYMRTLFNAEGHLLDRVDALTNARLARQDAIARAHVTMIIGQQALSYLVGSPAIMTEQCAFLVNLAERGMALHVLPEGTNMGVWGAISLATRGSSTMVLLETLEDVTSTSSDLVGKAMLAFEQILGAALPRADSLACIRILEETWKAKIT